MEGGKQSVLHDHDGVKKVKVQVFSSQYHVYEKFFKKDFAKRTATTQIIFGVIITVSQVKLMIGKLFSL